jgi:hypothetical protein
MVPDIDLGPGCDPIHALLLALSAMTTQGRRSMDALA